MVKLIWRSLEYQRDLQRHIKSKMVNVALLLEGEAKILVSRGNVDGSNPSRPGEAPKVVTGTLRANISHQVLIDRGDVIGVFGVKKGLANKYAPALEFGSKRMEARPFLRPTLLQNRVKILNLLG
jgi:HK97 gp10 family phage protein